MRHSYHTEQWLPCPTEQVFAFFSNPQNLPLLMRSWQKARIDTSTIAPPPAPEGSRPSPAAGSGSRLTLSFRPFPFLPVRMRWVAEIVEFKWNERFCDRQISGPFSYWNHCHYLQRQSQSGVPGTLIADDLEYDWNDSIAGQLVHRLFLRRQLRRTFAYRQAQVSRILVSLIPANPPHPSR
jgi:ligand-binding SRPBCC domain-containing protein